MGVEPKLSNEDPWELMQAFATHEYGRGGYGRNGNRYQPSSRYNQQQQSPNDQMSPADGYQDAMQDMQGYGDPSSQASQGPIPIMADGTGGQMSAGAGQENSPISSGGPVAAMIIKAAQARGVDPNVALQVASSEGGLGRYRDDGDGGSSHGPFQLHYGGVAPGGNAVGGMGDDFTAKYHAPANSSNVQDQVDFALDNAKQHGWGAWHGYKGGQWDGIQRGNGATPVSIGPRADNSDPVQAPATAGQAQPQQTAQNDQSDPDLTDPTSRLSWLS